MARKEQGIGIVSGWQDGFGGEDFLRELVQRTVQQVLEAEMTSFLGAEAYHCNDVRRGWPVSDRVGNVRNNDPQLLEPTP